MRTIRARYFLVRLPTDAALTAGLCPGDVLAVFEGGDSAVLRHVSRGPPLGIRARLVAEGTLQALEPNEFVSVADLTVQARPRCRVEPRETPKADPRTALRIREG